jgi:hypothetical protein
MTDVTVPPEKPVSRAATVTAGLPIPANGRNRRNWVTAGRSGEGLLTEPSAAAHPLRPGLLLMPQTGPPYSLQVIVIG